MAFLFRENRRHGTEGQRNRRSYRGFRRSNEPGPELLGAPSQAQKIKQENNSIRILLEKLTINLKKCVNAAVH